MSCVTSLTNLELVLVFFHRSINGISIIFLIDAKMGAWDLLFFDPMYDIFLHLPYLGWGGKTDSQICSSMTGIEERHWIFEGSSECSKMIARSFSSKMTLLRSSVQIYLILVTSLDVLLLTRRKILSFFFISNANDAVR